MRAYKKLNKKLFKELDKEYQDKIKCCGIRSITFLKGSDPNLKFKIFERLNSGSMSLNYQELRNCVYHGSYNDLLRELSQDSDFRKLMNYKDSEHPRMLDVQQVLRFAAFFNQTHLKYKGNIRNFLDKEMLERREIGEEKAKELKAAFKKAVSLNWSLWGDKAFRRFIPGDENSQDGKWESDKLNASLFDVLMFTMAKAEKPKIYANLDSVQEALVHLMGENKEFIDSILLKTSNSRVVKKRFDIWSRELDKIIEATPAQGARCFSRDLKKKLFEANPICKICNQQILHMDDAAVDHIEQYWRGGRTIEENARLAHRYCNNARPRKD